MEDLSAEERELAAMVREFADTVVAPQAYEADRTHTLSMGVVHRWAISAVRSAVPGGVRRTGR